MMELLDVTPQQAADIASIGRLAAICSEAICRGAVEEAVLVDAPDGVLSSATTDDAVGHDAIVTTIRKAIESFEFVFNTTLPGVIRVDGDRAFARFPVTELAKRRDGSALHFLGLYDDELRHTPVGWRFSRRTLSGLTLGRIDSFERSRTHTLPPYPGLPSWGVRLVDEDEGLRRPAGRLDWNESRHVDVWGRVARTADQWAG